MRLDDPIWLLALALIPPLALVGWRWFAAMAPARKFAAILCRAVLVVLLALMLAGLSSVQVSRRFTVVAVVDTSQSVRLFGRGPGALADPSAAVRRWIADAARLRGPDDALGVVAFDGVPATVLRPTAAPIEPPPLDASYLEGTDIAAALRRAAALIGSDSAGRIVLFSDGNPTAGDALAAAAEVAGRGRGGIPVDTVPIPLDASGETVVESLDAPPRAADGATITLRVALSSPGPARGTLQILHESETIDINGDAPGKGRTIDLPGGRHVELVQVPLPSGRVHRFEAVWEPQTGDLRSQNNSARAFTLSPGKGSVLIVSSYTSGGPLAATLRRAGLQVAVMPPEGMPTDLLGLQAYDLVFLDNVPAEAVSPVTRAALVAHVRDMGAGLVMLGGPDSFGAGGWKGSELEPILPVRLDLPERLVQPDAAIVFVLDNSGSMRRPVLGSAYSQQEIANQSAALAVKSLDARDLIGVIAFNSTYSVVVPLAPNTDPKATGERILRIHPDGGTVLGPAISAAANQLREVKAAIKHIIVLTDGISTDAASLPALVTSIRTNDGITLSAISVGDQADESLLAKLASIGGGTFYAVANPSLLPRLFLKAVRIVRSPMLKLGRFQPVLTAAPSPLTTGLGTPPTLTGFVLTQPRPEPTITTAMLTASGEPLLAHWPVGLGQVVAFTSDAHNWARDWIDWAGFERLWVQSARSLSRPGTSSPYELTVEPSQGMLRIRVESPPAAGTSIAAEGATVRVPATIYAPDGTPTTIELDQTAPGVYEATAPAPNAGTYLVAAMPRAGSRALAPVLGGAPVASGVELARLSTDPALMAQIAARTGGRTLTLDTPPDRSLFDRRGIAPPETLSPLWPVLLIWTIVALLADIAMRRIAWDRFVSREFGVDLRAAAEQQVMERGTAAARASERLRALASAHAAPAEAASIDSQAAELAARIEQERLRARLESLRAEAARASAPVANTIAAGASPGPGSIAPSDAGSDADAPREAEGLFAAKRRARARLDDQSEGKAP
ncbi:MAG: VWA domain-containing protein [Phycisphaerae bacterium]|nr:VWA domain-containing protein [Phycisphaerae bacterium]